MAENPHRDAVIVGGGHNGLVCASYLAAAGLKVTVLERRHVVGGAAVTEEFHPGFRNSVAAYTVSLLNPKVIRDLDLAAHGLRVVERGLANFLPLPAGEYLKVGAGRTAAEVAKFSANDAARLAAYADRLDRVADVLRALVLETPPNVTAGGLLEALPQLLKTARLGRHMAKLDMPLRRELLDLFAKSAGDYLDGWFESAPIKAAYGFDGIVGNYASPYARGLRLCPAAPRVRRGQRQERRLGTCDRRHGRDHPGHGQARPRRAASRSGCRARSAKSPSRADA